MGTKTGIVWTDHTWNPWRGCTKVSAGCDFCYMFRDQTRYGRDPSVVVRAAPATFDAPLTTWRAPARVFTCSWSDFFHADADPWRADAWDVIRRTPHLTYQILTKRIGRLLAEPTKCLPPDWGTGWPHVWLGVSVESEAVGFRADYLRRVPAVVHFLSAEPLLGPLDGVPLAGIEWVIGGGESGGPDDRRLVARDASGAWVPTPEGLRWARDLRDRCQRQGVPFVWKQWGGPLPHSGGRLLDGRTWDQFPAPLVAPAGVA